MSDTNNGGARQTLVEEGTLFKGSLSSSCPIVVRGKIDGELEAPSLTVSASGAVRGTVKVGELRSQGEIAGEFDADQVQLSGTVKDNTTIRAKSLEVKLSSDTSRMQVIFGECALEVGDAPTKEKEASRADAGGEGKKGKNKQKESIPPPPDGAPAS
jgi:cytoskeletal protein CcmA (bactofilin family)